MIALVVENPLGKTGVGRYTRYLIDLLDSNCIEYDIIDYTKTLSHDRVVSKRQWYRRLSYILVLFGFRDIITLNKYDLFIFPTASPMSVLTRGKRIVAVHDLMHKFYNFREVSRFDIRTYRDCLYGSLSKSMVTVVLDSEVGAEHWKMFFGHANKTVVIPFYADLESNGQIKSDLIRDNDLDNYLLQLYSF